MTMRETMHKIGTKTETRSFLAIVALAMLLSAALAFAATDHNGVTPFMICGNISYGNGTQCNDPAVNITNLNTGEGWQAGTGGNYYQITLISGIDLNATETLRFNVTDGTHSNTVDHTITIDEVWAGGLFCFNLTLEPVRVSIADTTADLPDTVTLPIMITSIGNYGTGTIDLTYDPAVVHVTDVTGSSDSTVTAKNIDNTAGLVRISAWNSVGVSGDIVFANVTFTSVGVGSTPLNLTVDTLQDTSYQEIPSVTIDNGSITVPDTTLPIISITSPTDGQAFTTPTITVNGTASDNVGLSKVEVKVGSGSWQTTSGTTSWTTSVTLASGSNTIYARATDTSGNTKETSVTVTYTPPDTTAPVVNTVDLNPTTPNTGDAILVTVNATDYGGVTNVAANGFDLTHQGGNIWNGTITAIVGTHSVNVSAKDAAGNTGWNNSTSYTATTPDATPPASITVLQNTTYQETYINWTWTDPTDDDFSHVMVYLDGTFKANVSAGIQFYNATELTHNATYKIATRTVDSVGNVNATWVNDTARTKPSNMSVTATPASVFVNTPTDVVFNVTSDGAPVDGALVTLSDAFGNVSTTGADGTVTIVVNATSTGTINVAATKDGYATATTTVTVEAPVLTTITVSPTTASMTVDETQLFTATAYDQFGNAMPDVVIAWNSSDTTVGTVDPESATTDADGNATTIFIAVADGATTVRAANGAENGTAAVTVTPPANITYSTLNVTPTSGTAPLNITVSAMVENTGGVAGDYNATLKVDEIIVGWNNGTLAVGANTTVSFEYTLVTAGTHNVTIDELTATVEVAESGITKQLDRVEISPDSADLLIGDTQSFSAICYATNATGGGTISDCTVTWTCDSPAVGTINSSTGLFTAGGVGTATVTVTAKYEGSTKTDTAIVNVSGSAETVSVDGDNFTVTIDAGTAADINVSGEFNKSVTGGSVVITPIADPEANVSVYQFTGNDEALIGLIVEPDTAVRDELADGNDTIRIEMCYNTTELASKNINSGTLAIWRFNKSTNEWVKMVKGTDPCVDNGRDGNCVWIEVNNLSKFALVGTKSTPPSRRGGGGAGTYPPGWGTTPAVTATAAHEATPGATAAPSGKYVTPTPKKPATAAEGVTAGAAAKAKKTTPGFEAVFAIAGLLAIAYVLMRRRE